MADNRTPDLSDNRCMRPDDVEHQATFWRTTDGPGHWVCDLCHPCPFPQVERAFERAALLRAEANELRRECGALKAAMASAVATMSPAKAEGLRRIYRDAMAAAAA